MKLSNAEHKIGCTNREMTLDEWIEHKVTSGRGYEPRRSYERERDIVLSKYFSLPYVETDEKLNKELLAMDVQDGHYAPSYYKHCPYCWRGQGFSRWG